MRERRFFLTLLLTTIALLIISVGSVVIFSINLASSGKVNDNIFELVAYVFYFVILVTALALTIRAITYGSMVIKAMVYQRNSVHAISYTARAIIISLGTLAFVLFGYFFLSLFIPQMPVFNFPIVLIYLIINASLTILTYSIFFYIYPYSNERNKKS